MIEGNFRRLNSLLREAANKYDISDSKISEDTLFACIEGKASDVQLAELQEALDKSVVFRRKFVQMQRDYQSLLATLESPVFQKAESILPQNLRTRLAKESSSETDQTNQPSYSFLGAIRKTVSLRLIQVLVVGAVPVLVFFLSRTPIVLNPQFAALSGNIAKNELISITTRGIVSSGVSTETAREAAILGFRILGTYDIEKDGFTAFECGTPGFWSEWFGSAEEIDIIDASQNKLGSIWYDGKLLNAENISNVELWLLDLPSRQLRKAALQHLDNSIQIPGPIPSLLLAVITYQKDESHFVAGGTALHAPKHE